MVRLRAIPLIADLKDLDLHPISPAMWQYGMQFSALSLQKIYQFRGTAASPLRALPAEPSAGPNRLGRRSVSCFSASLGKWRKI
jgi:hypothetical protein